MTTGGRFQTALPASLLVACGITGQDGLTSSSDASTIDARYDSLDSGMLFDGDGSHDAWRDDGGGTGAGGDSASGSGSDSGSGSGGGSGSGSGSDGGSDRSSGSGSGSSSSGAGSSNGSGSGSGLCTYGTAYNGNGSFTWYFFGQGTPNQNGVYLTACGYQGTESAMIDTVQNIANTSPASSTYFAAVPGSSGFNTVNQCGACVRITNGATSIVATIIDECPTDNGSNPACAQPGHLDLSYAAWKALGYSRGDPSGTTWGFVSCPVSGNITARVKSGNNDQVYLQNTVLPIVSVTYNGQPANHLSYGVWQLPNAAPAAGATLTLTDVEGHTVTIAIPPAGGDTGKQFPARCP